MKAVSLFAGVVFIAVSVQPGEFWASVVLVICGAVLLTGFVYGDWNKR